VSLKDFRKNLVIELYNEAGQLVLAYKVFRAWVSEYQVLPDLDANASSVAFETLELEIEGWERDGDVAEPSEPSFSQPSRRGWSRCQRRSSQRRPIAAAQRGHTWTTRPASRPVADCASAQSTWGKRRRPDQLSWTPHSVWWVPGRQACTTPAGIVDPSGCVHSSVAVTAALRMGVTCPPASQPMRSGIRGSLRSRVGQRRGVSPFEACAMRPSRLQSGRA
jgi:hypothetical protein